MKLSEYVKNYRGKHRLSLRQMAEKCDCSFQYISKLEKDEVSVPTAKMLANLAKGMGMTLHDLLTAVDDMEMYYSSSFFNKDNSHIKYPHVTEEESALLDAFNNAEERTKKMVRMLLGLE
jgi:transcriptional regulator with XRE-family HTH domain